MALSLQFAHVWVKYNRENNILNQKKQKRAWWFQSFEWGEGGVQMQEICSKYIEKALTRVELDNPCQDCQRGTSSKENQQNKGNMDQRLQSVYSDKRTFSRSRESADGKRTKRSWPLQMINAIFLAIWMTQWAVPLLFYFFPPFYFCRCFCLFCMDLHGASVWAMAYFVFHCGDGLHGLPQGWDCNCFFLHVFDVEFWVYAFCASRASFLGGWLYAPIFGGDGRDFSLHGFMERKWSQNSHKCVLHDL